jgi:GDP/UDP-N,N'-diacetylbacillosamine 2-epimerase (hydrolysing)
MEGQDLMSQHTACLSAETSKATVGIFTANRAEYGLLAPLIAALKHTHDLQPVLLVAQDHWLTGTVAEIEADGHAVDIPLKPVPLPADLPPGQRMTRLCADLMHQLAAYPPRPMDALVILGDRFEAAACAMAARLLEITLIHLGGGDITQGGCVDDDLRNVITCLSQWHGPMTTQSSNRLLSMGIDPSRIVVTGSLGYDNIHQLPLLAKADIYALYQLNPDQPVALFTQHPIPADGPATVTHFDQSLQALKALHQSHGLQTIASHPNSDGYNAELKQVMAQHPWVTWAPSMGRLRYLSMMGACDVVVGNTSSGLIETPFFGTPSVSIGPRQAGRQRGPNSQTCPYGIEAVSLAVKQALKQGRYPLACNPFGHAPAAPVIIQQLIRPAVK